MPNYCVVTSCKSVATKDDVRFFSFPSKAIRNSGHQRNILRKQRHEMWVRALGRGPLSEKFLKYARVCAKHFINGEPAHLRDRHNPDWVPTLNMGTEKPVQTRKSRKRRLEKEQDSTQNMPRRCTKRGKKEAPDSNKKSFDFGANFENVEFEVYDEDEDEGQSSETAEEFGNMDSEFDDMDPEYKPKEVEFINCDEDIKPPKVPLYKNFELDKSSQFCWYLNCTTDNKKNPNVALFPVPNKSNKNYDEWIENAGLKDRNYSVDSQKFVCVKHFEPSAFINPATRRRLKRDAVPIHYKPKSSSPVQKKDPKVGNAVNIIKGRCVICKDKLNSYVLYVKVPDNPYIRRLWQISTQTHLEPSDIVCEKHFPMIDVPDNYQRKNRNVDIFNHIPQYLPCLTPHQGCCVKGCTNSNSQTVKFYTFDLRYKTDWLHRLDNDQYYDRSDRDLLRLRACFLHFHPNLLKNYKNFETEIVPSRNLPGFDVDHLGTALDSESNDRAPYPASSPTLPKDSNLDKEHTILGDNPDAAVSIAELPGRKVTKIVIDRTQCLYKECQNKTEPSCKLYRLPINLEKAKRWLMECSKFDILKLADKHLLDFVNKAHGICERHIERVYNSDKSEAQKLKLLCGFKSCSSSYLTESLLFPYPDNIILREKWLENTGVSPKSKDMKYFMQNIGVCINHFTCCAFNGDMELLPGAVPKKDIYDNDEYDDEEKIIEEVEVHEEEEVLDEINSDYTNFADPNSTYNAAGILTECVVPQCFNDIKKSDVPFHYFPNPLDDRDRYKMWAQLIRDTTLYTDPKDIFRRCRICADHFDSSCFMDSNRKKLKKSALPMKNVPRLKRAAKAMLDKYLAGEDLSPAVPRELPSIFSILDDEEKEVTDNEESEKTVTPKNRPQKSLKREKEEERNSKAEKVDKAPVSMFKLDLRKMKVTPSMKLVKKSDGHKTIIRHKSDDVQSKPKATTNIEANTPQEAEEYDLLELLES